MKIFDLASFVTSSKFLKDDGDSILTWNKIHFRITSKLILLRPRVAILKQGEDDSKSIRAPVFRDFFEAAELFV